MAGHSKWANIKFRKEKADAKRGKIFSRIAKEIISAVKLGGPDPKANARLRLVLLRAKEANVPNDIVDRNIKKAASKDQADFFELTYELYGHGGVGIICDVMTDNKNRIASDLRIATNKKGGTIASVGSVAFNFDRKGIIQVNRSRAIEDQLFHFAIDAGAQEFEVADDYFIITTDPQALYQVKDSLVLHQVPVEEASLEMVPKVTVSCNEESMTANQALIEWLERIDDVDAVWHNME
jgi:YebC/PmpR family DNA-binding regulatory protein